MKQIWYGFKNVALTKDVLILMIIFTIANQLSYFVLYETLTLNSLIWCAGSLAVGLVIGAFFLPKILFYVLRKDIRKSLNRIHSENEINLFKRMLRNDFILGVIFPKDLQKLNDLIESYK